MVSQSFRADNTAAAIRAPSIYRFSQPPPPPNRGAARSRRRTPPLFSRVNFLLDSQPRCYKRPVYNRLAPWCHRRPALSFIASLLMENIISTAHRINRPAKVFDVFFRRPH